jgi:LysM repeat protein
MRKFLVPIVLAVLANIGLAAPTATDAQAGCTHFGVLGGCPVNILDGSTSTTVNADGTINWNTGGVSGPCCPAASGTETGAGLFNLNNQLAPSGPGSDPTNTIEPGGPAPSQAGFNVEVDPATGRIVIVGRGWSEDECSGYQCQGNTGATLFGSGPNGGYLCDSGGAGCGSDIWIGLPQTGFGECGPGGCGGGPSVVLPINPTGFAVGPYAQNSTLGNVDPFGGGFNTFLDPDTGAATTIDADRRNWPERVQHAADLNAAYINGEIAFYPFSDPDWATKSVEDFTNSTPPPANSGRNNGANLPSGISTVQPSEALYGVVQPGETLFRIALRLGVSTQSLAAANGLAPDAPVSSGQVLTIPPKLADGSNDRDPLRDIFDIRTLPRSDYYDSLDALANRAARDGLGGYIPPTSPASNKGAPVGGKAGRVGIGSEPTIGGTGFTRNPNTPGTIINQAFGTGIAQPPETTSGEPSNGTPNPGKRSRFGIGTDTSLGGVGGISPRMQVAKNFGLQGVFSYSRIDFEPKPDNSDLTGYVSNVIVAIAGSGFAQPGQTVPFTGPSGTPTTVIPIGNESNVVNKTNLKSTNGQPVTLLPPPQTPGGATVQANGSNIADSITGNVPDEFRAPVVGESTREDGSKVIFVNIPGARPGTAPEFFDRKGAEVMVEALRDGKGYMEAFNAGRDVDDKIRQAASERQKTANATGITTTPDGLASASVPGARTPTTIVPRPARPEGDSVGFMEQATFQRSIYRLEIIRTPNGRTLAVGTGEHAGHVFGETKEGSFGWRREGPWTPPPAPAPFIGNQRPAIIVSPGQPADNGGRVVTDLPGKIEPGDTVKVAEIGGGPGAGVNDNIQIRIGIANSDRDFMNNPGTITFDPAAASGFSSTNR